MIWIRDWIFFLTRIIKKTFEPNWCFIFFVKLQIPATKSTCDWDFPGKFCVSNSSSCINRSIGAHGMHIRDTCQCDGKEWMIEILCPVSHCLLWWSLSTVIVNSLKVTTVRDWCGTGVVHTAHKIIYVILKFCQEKCEFKYS